MDLIRGLVALVFIIKLTTEKKNISDCLTSFWRTHHGMNEAFRRIFFHCSCNIPLNFSIRHVKWRGGLVHWLHWRASTTITSTRLFVEWKEIHDLDNVAREIRCNYFLLLCYGIGHKMMLTFFFISLSWYRTQDVADFSYSSVTLQDTELPSVGVL